jgi:hypothetical protein
VLLHAYSIIPLKVLSFGFLGWLRQVPPTKEKSGMVRKFDADEF